MKYLIPAIIVIIVFLYLRFFFKRLRLLISLKKAAKDAGVKLTLTTPVFWLPTNRGKRSELVVTGYQYTYSIKVLGLFQKYCDLHFWSPREYATRKFLFHWQIAQAAPLGKTNARRKALDIDFSKGLPFDASRNIFPFYLLSPTNSPIHITKNDGNVIADLALGDKIGNVIFADREYLYQYIRLALHTYTPTKRFDR